jgi:hypothetical protein
VVVGGAVCTLATSIFASGTFAGGMGVVEDGVAGVGAGLPGPPGPKGTPAVDWLGLKPGSELRMASLRSAYPRCCFELAEELGGSLEDLVPA